MTHIDRAVGADPKFRREILDVSVQIVHNLPVAFLDDPPIALGLERRFKLGAYQAEQGHKQAFERRGFYNGIPHQIHLAQKRLPRQFHFLGAQSLKALLLQMMATEVAMASIAAR